MNSYMQKTKTGILQIKLRDMTVFLLTVIAFWPTTSALIQLPWFVPYIAGVMILVFGWISEKGSKRSNLRVGVKIVFMELLPYLVFFLITFLLILAGLSIVNLFRLFSIFGQMIAIGCLCIGLFWMYGKNAIDFAFWCMCAVYIPSFIAGIVDVGFAAFFDYLSGRYQWTSYQVLRWFELHDICLTMPLYVLYYFSLEKEVVHRRLKIVLAVAISISGYKRIAIAALIVTLVVLFFVQRKTKNNALSLRGSLSFEAVLCVGALIWLYCSATGLFDQLCIALGIDTLGRTNMYALAIRDIGSNSVFGQGWGFVNYLLQNYINLGLVDVAALHNDFLRVYIEAGPVLFFMGVIYYCFVCPEFLKMAFGETARSLYLIASLYAFVVYMTDNTMAYTVFQATLLLLFTRWSSLSLSERG